MLRPRERPPPPAFSAGSRPTRSPRLKRPNVTMLPEYFMPFQLWVMGARRIARSAHPEYNSRQEISVFTHAFGKMKRVVTIVCITAACAFCVQSTVIAIDRIEHALEIDHDANSIAGSVVSCADAPADCAQYGGGHPVSHSHMGDTISPFFVAVDFDLIIPLSARGGADPLDGSPRCGIGACAPDRPPKA